MSTSSLFPVLGFRGSKSVEIIHGASDTTNGISVLIDWSVGVDVHGKSRSSKMQVSYHNVCSFLP